MTSMTRGQVAAAADVNPETLRYYERRGLLTPRRDGSSNYRLYDSDAVSRVRFIKGAQRLGFPLEEIDELLLLSDTASADCADVRVRARAHLASIDERLTELTRMRDAMVDLIEACPGDGPLTECPILASFCADTHS